MAICCPYLALIPPNICPSCALITPDICPHLPTERLPKASYIPDVNRQQMTMTHHHAPAHGVAGAQIFAQESLVSFGSVARSACAHRCAPQYRSYGMVRLRRIGNRETDNSPLQSNRSALAGIAQETASSSKATPLLSSRHITRRRQKWASE